MKKILSIKKNIVSFVFSALLLVCPIFLFSADAVKEKSTIDTIFSVVMYIGIYGGIGGAIISVIVASIKRKENKWSEAKKILSAGLTLAAFSFVIEIIIGWM
ncbi:hypothetical protein J5690_09515 [bacterium]|nr:hypothetical protein [bacterium]